MAAEGATQSRKRPASGPPSALEEEAQEHAKAWTEVFTLFQQSGRDDRGAAYAMSMGSLRRRGEEIDQHIEALRFAERRLLQHIHSEVVGFGCAADAPEAARAWGRALASSLGLKVRQVAAREAAEEPPWEAAVMADEAHAEALRMLADQKGFETDAEAKARQEAEAKAETESDAARQEREELERARSAVLRSRGLNSRRLPLRPGVPPCGRFMRRGVCRSGRACRWDHPEPDLNSGGYPLRPGERTCAAYRRSQTCKFGVLCTSNHPDPARVPEDHPGALPLALARAASQQAQLQLMLHLQLLQELGSLQDPEAMKNAWMRFRYTFSLGT